MKLLISISFLIMFACCKRGNPQVVKLRNASSENIYFLVSENKVLTNPNEIAKVRPVTSGSIAEERTEYKDKEEAKSIKQNLYRYQIEKDSTETILSSESAGIFVNSISIQSIIKDRYNGQLHIFIITQNDLLKYSDQEIIDKKMCKYFKSLTDEEVAGDALILEYFYSSPQGLASDPVEHRTISSVIYP